MFYSKIHRDTLYECCNGVLQGAKDKPRKFTETVELQISLKNYDPQKDKRFSGTVKLRSIPRPKMKVCVLGDASHCDEAKANDIPCMDAEALKKLNKNKKLVKKLGKLERLWPTTMQSVFLISLICGCKSVWSFVHVVCWDHMNRACSTDQAVRTCEKFVYSIVKITRLHDYQMWQTFCWEIYAKVYGLFTLIVVFDLRWLCFAQYCVSR